MTTGAVSEQSRHSVTTGAVSEQSRHSVTTGAVRTESSFCDDRGLCQNRVVIL